MKVNKFQKQLLEESRHNMFLKRPMSKAIEKAFLETPRHSFIKRYRLWPSKEWHEIDSNNLEEHLATLYSDKALILWGDDNENITSSISQPSLVLYMLDMLKLESGHKVFELGAGSGWNAALMGHIVGPKGHVYSLEIIPELAKPASETVEALGLKNVSIIEGDGGEGYAAGTPYDRAMFTAGSFDLPHHFYEQIKKGGLLLIVFKVEGGADNLFLLRKTADHFEAIDSLCCGFVQMTGKYAINELEPVHLETLPNWTTLKNQEISRTPFWWGGKGPGFRWRTLGIR
jgi:protein-L-isoaspartate(D-aspartate) O-methyltransferase